MGSEIRNLCRKLSAFGLIVGVVSVCAVFATSATAHAAAGVNQQLNFQGRLLDATGAVVPDGYYNIEFKIYQDGDGLSQNDATPVGSAGTLLWTEDYIDNNANAGVQVINGYMSAQLGSICSFGGGSCQGHTNSAVNWNDNTLWLSMNIAGDNNACTSIGGVSCAADGEMTPMKRLSANAYALNSQELGGMSSGQFVQLAQGLQTDATTSNSIYINKTGASGNLIDLQTSGADTFMINNSGNEVFGANAGHSMSVATAAASTAGQALTVSAGAAGTGTTALTGGTLTLDAGAGGGTNGNGGNLALDAGAPNGTGTAGSITIGGNYANTVQLGNASTATQVKQEAGGATTTLSSTGGEAIAGSGTTNATNALKVMNSGGTSLFQLVDDGTVDLGINALNNPALTINNSGNIVTTTTVATTSTVALVVQNTSGNQVLDVDTSNNDIVLGKANTAGDNGKILFNSAGGSNYVGISAPTTNPNSSYVLALPSTAPSASSQCLETGSTFTQLTFAACGGSSGSFINNAFGTTQAGNLDIQGVSSSAAVAVLEANNGGTGDILDFLNGTGTTVAKFDSSGNFTDSAAGTSSFSGTLTVATEIETPTLDTASATPLNIGTTNASQINLNKNVQITGNTTYASGANRSINVNAAGAGSNGNNLTITAGAGGTGTTNGGNLILQGGAGSPTGVAGLVVINTPTFQSVVNDANCYTGGALVAASCTIAQTSVDDNAAVVVGFNTASQTATLPAPTNTTPGKVFYIMAANGSQNFTLSVNSGGTGNTVAMRANTSATMVWNGSEWGAAGASSSTTLQAAYDNTLLNAGGAELVVSHTSNTDGLNIRDSSVNPVNGPLLTVQTNSDAVLFSVNSGVNEYSSDSGAETAGSTSSTFPYASWTVMQGAGTGTTINRYTTVGDDIATGQASVQVNTSANANAGVSDQLTSALTANLNYNVSFAARLGSGTFTTMKVNYSMDGTTGNVVPCTTSGQIVTMSIWTKVNCTFTAPASGINAINAIQITQTDATARTFYVDNLSVTIAANQTYATDGDIANAGSFTTNWPAVGASVTRSTSVGEIGSVSAQVQTTGGNQGVANKLSINPLPSTLYLVTVYADSNTSGFNDFTVQYTPDGGTTFIPCVDYNTQTVSPTLNSFTEITCYITTTTTSVTNPQVRFTQPSTDSTARTFYVDAFSMTLSTNTTPQVQIGGGLHGGPATLFTLDRAASAPIASNNEAFLGSMYYDTTLGELQCYESSGWGACGSSPNTVVTISPEYTNAVMHGTGVGTMTSDFCSGASFLKINDGSSGQPAICSANQTFNFYKWTSPQPTSATYSIYVTYELPDTFKSFASGQTSVEGLTDSANSSVQYEIYRQDAATGLNQCGTVAVPVASGSGYGWQPGTANGAEDPSTCGFVPNDSIVFKIDLTADQNANAYVSNLNFTFSHK